MYKLKIVTDTNGGWDSVWWSRLTKLKVWSQLGPGPSSVFLCVGPFTFVRIFILHHFLYFPTFHLISPKDLQCVHRLYFFSPCLLTC